MPKHLVLNVNLLTAGAHPAAWRSPGGNPRALIDPAHFKAVAREAERGLLDAVFLSDAVMLKGGGAGMPVSSLDPAVAVTVMAGATEHIGFIASTSATFQEPYHIARTFASLDHVSGGRVGWNVVTTRDRGAAANFGGPPESGERVLPPREQRYARAAESIEVVQALWDSWEDEALLADPVSGRFSDPARIHPIDHRGAHFQVAGPLQVPRPPQGRIPIVQAGGSEGGRELAARYADAVFTAQHLIPQAAEFAADIRRRAARYGRDPRGIKILPGVNPIIGSTVAEARARKAELDALVDDASRVRGFAAFLGLDPGSLELDRPFPPELVPPLGDTYGSEGFTGALRTLLAERPLTVRELLERGTFHRDLVGTPEQLADSFQEWSDAGAADGFNLQFARYPDHLTDFVDHVLPVLRRRGLVRSEYTDRTLRARLGLPRPASRYAPQEVSR
ncbi:NtaA/DmoA family FMN-dependent monooxygenase [Nocardia sp. NPDC057227]|uniref:NtaA/DmoA family FMN-dependent monooxygenase n=1 Tax=Nocardia sp. NPDC057227 TaxID=3346056 RepID=UPI00364355A5